VSNGKITRLLWRERPLYQTIFWALGPVGDSVKIGVENARLWKQQDVAALAGLTTLCDRGTASGNGGSSFQPKVSVLLELDI